MLSGDCNICINGKMPTYSATCVECGLSRKNFKPITNADRIRAMTDEELANWYFNEFFPNAPYCNKLECYRDSPCEQCLLDWLKQEV